MNMTSSTKRILSFMMAMLMVVSLLPMQSFALGNTSNSLLSTTVTTNTHTVTIGTETITLNCTDDGLPATGFKEYSEEGLVYSYKNTSSENQTVEVVVNNPTDKLLKFVVTRYEGTSLTVDGVAKEDVVNVEVEPGKSVKITLVAATDKYAEVGFTSFTLDAYTASGVTFNYDPALGSIMVGGQVREPGYSQEVDTNGVALVATPGENVTFLGWVDADSGKVLSTSASYNYKPTGEEHVKAAFAHKDAAAWFYVNQKTCLFNDLNAAVACVEANGWKGNTGIITLAADGYLPAGNYSISDDATLLIPYNEAERKAKSAPDISHSGGGSIIHLPISESKPFRTLTMKSGAVLNIVGELIVDSAVMGAAVHDVGMPHGPYGQIVLENGSQINVVNDGDWGILRCFGYIVGTYDADGTYTGGKVVAESGTRLYEVFQIRDMRGTKAMQDGQGYGCFPLTQYYVQNIEAQCEIKAGAKVMVCISVTDGNDSNKQATITFIGDSSSNAAGLFRLSSGKLVRVYDPFADRIVYTLQQDSGVAGEMSVDALNITVSSMSFSSNGLWMGINGNITMKLATGTKMTIKQKVKLLPGARIEVAEGATLEVAKNSGELFLYDAEEWLYSFAHYPEEGKTTNGIIEVNNENTYYNVVRYSPSRARYNPNFGRATFGSAQLHVDGLLVGHGNIFSSHGYELHGKERVYASAYDNVLTGTGKYLNDTQYAGGTIAEYINNTIREGAWLWENFVGAYVYKQPLLGFISKDTGAVLESFPNPTTTDGVTLYGGFLDTNANGTGETAEYIWFTTEVNPVNVHLMHNGVKVDEWVAYIYQGADLNFYYTDAACTTAATDAFTGDTLYTKATASITRNGVTKYFMTPNIAVLHANYGETVNVIEDVTIKDTILIGSNQNITLNLNNHSITAAGCVINNQGTLNIHGGATGEGMVPGKLITTGVATVMNTYGTIGTIGGNLLISAPSGDGIRVHKGKIGTIGGSGSDVKIEVRDYILVVAAAAEVTTIGGTDGKVTFVQNNQGGTIQYPFYVSGTVGTIGGTNANVTIKQTNKIVNHSATIFITDGGRIETIGGTNATINIIEDDQAATWGDFRIAIWINVGSIGTLGSGGTVNIISNNNGIYFGGSDACDAYIETIGAAGTVNITGPVVDGVQTACRNGIRVNATKHEHDIGTLGAGGIVNINASNYGVVVEKSLSDIDKIGTAGTVNITSSGVGIMLMAADAKINTIGAGGTVNITSASNGIYLSANGTKINTIGAGGNVTINANGKSEAILVNGGGRIETIGGPNANVTIDNTAGTNNNTIYIMNGSIGTIGSTGTGKVTINAYYRGILVMSADGDSTDIDLEKITGNVEINSEGACIFIASGNIVDMIGGAGSHIVMNQNSVLKADGKLNTEKYPDRELVNDPGIYLSGTLNTLGYGEGCQVTLNTRAKSIYLYTSTAKLGTLGGDNSQVTIKQNACSTLTPTMIDVQGTIHHIGGQNATVTLIQESSASGNNGNGILFNVAGKIENIGVQTGSKVLMHQTMKLSGDCGWGLYITGSGTVEKIGSDASTVEIIAGHCPVYLAGKITSITGNTLMVGKKNWDSSTEIFWMASGVTLPVGCITGGYYAQVGSTNVSDIFNAGNQSNITASGYAVSDHTVERISLITGETYHCFYVYTDHEHAYDTSTPVYTWEVRNGVVTLVSTIHCDTAGCMHDKVETAVATTSYSITGDTCEVTYTATLNGHTDSYSETMELAGTISMYYDDRLSGDISILDKGTPVSKKVGTNELDDAVVSFGNGKLIATGIGTALVYKDGYLYQVKVSPAPISLFMITGHSVGMGSKGDPGQSIKCEEGQVYSYNVTNHSTNGYDSSRLMDSVTGTMGLGWASAERPLNVDALTTGGGLQGEDSGLAWYWNQLTGEKVYVVNAAVGGTSLHQWVVDDNYTGTSPSKNPQHLRTNAIKQFTQAQQIIANEVAAGHFTLEDMVLLYHGSANGGYRGFDYTYENGPAMYDIFFDAMRTALNRDVDGDGDRDEIKIGFVPIWTRSKDHSVTSGTPNFYMETASALLMAASGNYSDIFLASLIGWDKWLTDEKVQEYFKDYEQKFTTQNGTTLDVPQSNLELYPYEKGDYVHYAQFAYNEMGADIARNIYKLLRDKSNANVSLRLFKTDGLTEVAAGGAETLVMQFGDRLTLVPVVDPISINDLTFEVSGSLGMKHPLTIYPIGSGVGTLKIYYQDTLLKTITIDMGDATAVAQIGDTLYYSVQDAIDASKAGDTVTLLTDVTLNNGLVIPEGKDLILDLNNHKIEYCGTANDKSVVTNHGTLSISGGALDKTPGTLFNTSLTESYTLVISNYGTINTIGGNLLIKNNAAFGAAIWANAGTIHTIGGPGSYVELDVKNIGIYTTGGTIETIGGENGTVKITAAQYPVYTNLGSIGTIGGKNSNVTITSPGNWNIINVEKGSIGLIGGENATVKIIEVGASAAIRVHGGTIGTIGATGTGLVDIDAAGVGISVDGSGSQISAIGGVGGKVNIASKLQAVEAINSGYIKLIGGANADVDMKQTATINAIAKTIYVTGGGRIEEIGGTNAHITIELEDKYDNTTSTDIAIWLYNGGSIGNLGSSGLVEIITNEIGIYVSDDSGKAASLEKLGDGGNVTITARLGLYVSGPTLGTVAANGGKVTIDVSYYGIHMKGTNAKITTLGGKNGTLIIDSDTHGIVLESATAEIVEIGSTGANVTITAAQRGIVLVTAGSKIGTIGAGGKVTINSVGVGLFILPGATVDTLGGENGHVILNQTTGTTSAADDLPVVHVQGTLTTIGAANATVEIRQNFKVETKQTHGKLIYVNGGFVETIGAHTGAKVLMDQTVAGSAGGNSHTGWGLDVRNSGRVTTVGSKNSLVEILAYGFPAYTDSSSSIETLTGNTLMLAKMEYDKSTPTMWTVTSIGTISGGYYACIGNNVSSAMFYSTQTFADGMGLSKYAVKIVAETDGNTYACFSVTDPVAKIGETGYYSIQEAIDAAQKGDTVVVLKDQYVATGLTVAAGKDIILDLGGKTISCAVNVITNEGILSISNGNLINTLTTTTADNGSCIYNRGTIGTIGGTMTLTTYGTYGAAICNNGGHIGTIGGKNSNITIKNTNIGIYVINSGTIDYIGGEDGGNVTVGIGKSKAICVDSKGNITTIGGKGAVITLHGDVALEIGGAGRVELIGGENAQITMTSTGNNAVYLHNDSSIGTIAATGTGSITLNAYRRGFLLITGANEIDTIGGNLSIQAGAAALYVAAGSKINLIGGPGSRIVIESRFSWQDTCVVYVSGGQIGTIGGTDGYVYLRSYEKASRVITMDSRGHIGQIGGTRAEVYLVNDYAGTDNTVLLNQTEASTIGTIGGTDAKVILQQRGASTGIQYGILVNGENPNYATIGQIGAGAERIEVIVDDCPMFVDSFSQVNEIGKNVLLAARTASSKSNSAATINGTSANVLAITGGYFCRGNATSLNSVVPTVLQGKAIFDTNMVEIVSIADGNTYTCFYVHEHTYEAPVITWNGIEASATVTCPTCGEGTKNKTVAAEVVVTEDESKATAGDCKTPGTKTYVAVATYGELTATDTIVVEDKLGSHSYQAAVTDPTCTAQGYTTHTCTICGDSYVDSYVDATGHSYSEPVFTWNGYECTAKVTCACGHEQNLDVEITSAVTTPATCVTKGVKTYTATTLWEDVTYTSSEHPTEELDIDSTNHIHTTNHKQQDATCTESGYTAGVFCEDCEQWISGHEEIKSSGHSYTETVTPPTCVDKGYTTHTCSVCGDTYTDNEVVATGHTPGEAVKENETPGSYESVVYCTECHTELSRETVTTGPVQMPNVKVENIGLVLKDYIGLQVAVNRNKMNNGVYETAYYKYVQYNPDGTEAASGTIEFNMAAGSWVGAEIPVLAWSMSDSFEITVYYEVNGVVYQGAAITTSVREQAMIRINSTKTDDVTVKTRALCVAMLNYGAAVQDYFNHNDADASYLANSELSAEQKVLPTFAELNLTGEVIMPDGDLKPSTKGLSARDKINVQFAVKNKDLSRYEVRYTIDGVEQKPIPASEFLTNKVGNNTYCGPSIAMTPRQMRSEIIISFYDAETGEKVYGDIICSVEALAKANEGKSTELLTIAMMVYGDAAEARFGK